MKNKTTITSSILKEKYIKIEHKSGLTVYVYPKERFSSTYAAFATEYGSVNTSFISDGKVIDVPAGIAHYLEHKMFESEEGDAFLKYAKTGASANAYTSFDKTAYLFSVAGNFKESFEILIDLIQKPYFTDENVEKERGIISQEIKMYDDDPDWKVLVNLLKNMYHKHPVRIDIAGTVESIAEITKEKLYDCYNAYYNLHNMVLVIAGKCDLREITEVMDKKLSIIKPVKIENNFENEPETVVNSLVEESFGVPIPLFFLGFKEDAKGDRITGRELAVNNVLLEIIGGRSSELYRILIEENLINSFSFSYECFEGSGFLAELFSGMSKDPKKCAQRICGHINKLRVKGIDEKAFIMARNDLYGRYIASFNNNQAVGTTLINMHFAGREIYEFITAIADITKDEVEQYLRDHLDEKRSTLSIIS